MGVDYVQDRNCRVKEALGLETLVELLKSRGQADLLMEQFEARGEDPAGASIRRVVMYPSGPVEERVPLSELQEAAAVLEPYAPICDGCTANFRQCPFGCCGYLNYPISDAEEQWLMARLPASASSVAGIYLRSVLRELDIDGGVVARMRQELFFEREHALERRLDGPESGFTVTSDQMLQFLFFSGAIDPLHAAFVCLFIGLIPHDSAADTVRAVLDRPQTIQDHLALDRGVLAMLEETQLGMFLLGMMSAAINLEALLIDA